MNEITQQTRKRIIGFIGLRLLVKILLILFLIFLYFVYILPIFNNNHNPAEILGEYQIPFGNMGDPLNKTELIEKDNYGRRLYSFESSFYTNVFRDYTGHANGNSSVFAYIIVQKTDKQYIYCYDDICYTYVKYLKNDNNDIINELKENNDWGKPINNEKMTVLSKDYFSKSVREYPMHTIEESTINILEKKIGYKIENYFIDAIFPGDTTPIFVLREVIDWGNVEKIEYGKSYIFFITDDSNAIYSELSNDIGNWNKEIHSFKQQAIS